MSPKKLLFHVGGPAFHPVAQQAGVISDWLGDEYLCTLAQKNTAFDLLDDCDLFVVMGLHWTGQGVPGVWPYTPLNDTQKQAFENYVTSGKPLLVHHGSVASYDDWPRFGELLGFTWVWGTTWHVDLGDAHVDVLKTGHPIVDHIESFDLHDELYYDIQVTEGLNPQVHAVAPWKDRQLPMVLTAEGGRAPGTGKVVYLANGHDMSAFESPELRQLWINSVNWLLNGKAQKAASA